MKRVHLRLGDLGLEAVVDEMAQAAARAACAAALAVPEKEQALSDAVRPALREVLGRYAVSFDLCGMSVICDEGAPVDAWGREEQEASE